jgi:drug/metabolite transporter (DMT)-like permease
LILAFWRDAFLVLALALGMLMTRRDLLRLPQGNLGYLAAYGAVLAAYNSVLTFSVAMNGAAVSTVLVYSSAVFTALLGRAVLHERLGGAKVAAVLLCLVGCLLATGTAGRAAWNVNAAGIAVGLSSGLAYAIYSLMGRSAGTARGIHPWTTLLYTFAFATAFLLLVNLAPWAGLSLPGAATHPADLLWLGRRVAGWAVLFALGAGPTLAGFGLYGVTLSLLPSSVANVLLTIEVPFTAVLAFAVLGERLSAMQVQGSLIVLAGVFMLRRWEVVGAASLNP